MCVGSKESEIETFRRLIKDVYPSGVEWSGKVIDQDLEFFFSIGETNGVYINGTMIRVDDDFMDFLAKLKIYYQKFKTKWAKVFKTITAKAELIPTKTLESKMNCFGVKKDCNIAIRLSNLVTYFLNIFAYILELLNYYYFKQWLNFSRLLFCLMVVSYQPLQTE